jgi:signal transduction histidine kinase
MELKASLALVEEVDAERRMLERHLRQSQKMEAIGTLAGGIAHDLKNIFTPILINSEMAVEDVGRDSPAYPLVKEILEAARMGTDLVKQIMTFTRQTSEEKVDVDVPSVVNETLSVLRSAIPKTIEIKTRINVRNAVVHANPTQIKQVLMNLGSNASYAMKGQHGVMEVDVSCVDLDTNSASKIAPELIPGSYVEVDVMDTGVGMDEKTIERIFEPFFTTKLHGEGTGMGLSVVQGIVRDLGGTISVWSKPGKGSSFRVLLPRTGRPCAGGTEAH